jgi:hypothetical protein
MHRHYREISATFFCFPLPKLVLGLEFSNEDDAGFFYILINKYSPKCDRPENTSDVQIGHNIQTVFQEA